VTTCAVTTCAVTTCAVTTCAVTTCAVTTCAVTRPSRNGRRGRDAARRSRALCRSRRPRLRCHHVRAAGPVLRSVRGRRSRQTATRRPSSPPPNSPAQPPLNSPAQYRPPRPGHGPCPTREGPGPHRTAVGPRAKRGARPCARRTRRGRPRARYADAGRRALGCAGVRRAACGVRVDARVGRWRRRCAPRSSGGTARHGGEHRSRRARWLIAAQLRGRLKPRRAVRTPPLSALNRMTRNLARE
jgi:hypothetical protein